MIGIIYEDLKTTFDSPEQFCETIPYPTYKRIKRKGFVGFVKKKKWNLLDLKEEICQAVLDKVYIQKNKKSGYKVYPKNQKDKKEMKR